MLISKRNISSRSDRAFTLVELLVVLVIIALLVGITLVATRGALRAGQRASTTAFMQSITEGIEQFRNDFGYIPPLIRDDGQDSDPNRALVSAQPNAAEEYRRFRYFSATTLPVYLVGVGRLEPSPTTSSGLDPARHDGHAGPGFRDPGPDRSWGGAVDRTQNNPTRTGRVYGPYIDAGDGEALRPIRFDDFPSNNAIAENPRYVDFNPLLRENIDNAIYVFEDAWGKPIRYYIPRWPRRDPITGAQSLERIPIELLKEEAITGDFLAEQDPELLSAEYALLSGGPDKRFTGISGLTFGGDLDLSMEPMEMNQTNTDLVDQVDSEIAGLRSLLRGVSDNVRLVR